MVRPMTSYPSSFKIAAAIELSSPPLIATATRPFFADIMDNLEVFTAKPSENEALGVLCALWGEKIYSALETC
jgi:hypothetical protein